MSHDHVTIGDVEIPTNQLRRAIDDFDGGTGEDGGLILSNDGCNDDDDVYVILRGEGSVCLRSLGRLGDRVYGLPEFRGWQMEEHVGSKGPYEVYADGEDDIWVKHEGDDEAVLFTSLSTH